MVTQSIPPVLKREIFGWAMYDFANSGYTTVVMTTIFNAYFVGVVAANGDENGTATLLWTIAVAISNALVVVSAPVVGVLVLDAGKLIAQGPPKAIAHNQTVIEAYFGKK